MVELTFDQPGGDLVPLWCEAGYQCELVAGLQNVVAEVDPLGRLGRGGEETIKVG